MKLTWGESACVKLIKPYLDYLLPESPLCGFFITLRELNEMVAFQVF